MAYCFAYSAPIGASDFGAVSAPFDTAVYAALLSAIVRAVLGSHAPDVQAGLHVRLRCDGLHRLCTW